MRESQTKNIAMIAVMAALTFVATYIIRIPTPATGGYIHIGDCMVFLSVLLLGRKRGAAAGALGAGMSDLLAGAAAWIIPTLVIKYVMATILGVIMEKDVTSHKRWLAGSVVGGIFQVFAYAGVSAVVTGIKPAIASMPGDAVQSAVGVVLFMVIGAALEKSGISTRLAAEAGRKDR
jgi:uncharacterized membrane protein